MSLRCETSFCSHNRSFSQFSLLYQLIRFFMNRLIIVFSLLGFFAVTSLPAFAEGDKRRVRTVPIGFLVDEYGSNCTYAQKELRNACENYPLKSGDLEAFGCEILREEEPKATAFGCRVRGECRCYILKNISGTDEKGV